jgi:hypothetical protein
MKVAYEIPYVSYVTRYKEKQTEWEMRREKAKARRYAIRVEIGYHTTAPARHVKSCVAGLPSATDSCLVLLLGERWNGNNVTTEHHASSELRDTETNSQK